MSDVQPVDREGNGYEGDVVSMIEHKPDAPYQPEKPLPPPGTPERIAAERRLVRKLDMRVLPTIIVIYIMNYIDRNGITTARLQGLEKDLQLSDVQYSVVLSILYVTYCPAQIPSNMALNYVARPSWYIGACVVAWGLVSAMTGVTNNFGGILACRIFLGLPETAFYPGAIYLLSRWYTKKELAFRSAILYAGLMLSNAFGALMAAGILAEMEGKRGIRAWRWLFFIEGAITIFVGLNAMWLLPDYPNNTRWISAADRRLAQARMADDAGEADKDNESDSLLHGLQLALADPKVLIFAAMTMLLLLGSSFVIFFPTLTQTLGFNTTISLVLAAPPWLLVTVICCLNAWHADRTGERFFHITGWWWSVIVGFIIALATMNTVARYISMILMALGYAGFGLTLVWVANAVPRPPAKRAAAIAIVNSIGNLGTLIGSFVWKVQWAPKYHQSMIISLCALVLSSVLAFTIRQMLVRENKRLDSDELQGTNRVRIEEAAKLEGISFEEALERRKRFRYLY
ncbi:tartrate transporter [Moniliophthora roreri MCA 2997]|uniref:Tartrate transporter n=1 Tax=Moniliophthora roreri (strain MCA 2997) TaxID=1381753 RepID=V2WYZ8_MONRO|nr:tartrate transporter [Moniliophthora roreri MCA 2997]